MKALDKYLQKRRMEQARRFVQKGARVLDIGCNRGELFRFLGGHISGGCGIDSEAPEDEAPGNAILIRGHFPEHLPEGLEFDAITLLAVLEHIPDSSLEALPAQLHGFLRSQGRVIVTVPSRYVDYILVVLRKLRLVEAKSFHEHHGYEPRCTRALFEGGGLFKLLLFERFQFGLNNLFVFERRDSS